MDILADTFHRPFSCKTPAQGHVCFFNCCTIISNCLSKHKFNDFINEYLQPLFNENMEIEQCDNKQTVTFNIFV